MTFALSHQVDTPRRKARVALDSYPTPAWCVRRLAEAVPSLLCAGGLFLEPSAGAGAIIRAASAAGVGALWTAVELDTQHEPALRHLGSHGLGAVYPGEDFLEWAPAQPPSRFDLALGNPPFSLALEFVQASLPISRQVCFLLRVGFLETSDRNAWVREHTPDLYVLPNRPQFRHGATDSCVYAWHWWPTVDVRREGRVVVLADTPLAERKRG